MTKRMAIIAVVAAISVGLLSGVGSATQIVLNPTGWTQLFNGGHDWNPSWTSWPSVGISYTLPSDFDGSTVNSALLSISRFDSYGDVNMVIDPYTSAFPQGGNADSATWINSPEVLMLSLSKGYGVQHDPIEIAAIAQYWADGNANYGIRVQPTFASWTIQPNTTLTLDYTAAEIPEPGTMLLLGAGALGVFGYFRRRGMR